MNQGAHGGAIAEAVSRIQRVLLVQLHPVVIGQGDGDASLRIFRRGFVKALLGHHQHRPLGGQFDGGAQASDTRADDQKIRHPLQDKDSNHAAPNRSCMINLR